MKTIFAALLGLVTALVFTSCVNLDPVPDPTRYYLLTAPGDSQPPELVQDGLRIGIREVRMPDYLEPSRIALRKGRHEIVYSDYRRWGERIDHSVARTLSDVLERRLNARYVSEFPWPSSIRHDYILRVNFAHFEGSSDGDVYVAGRWSLSSPENVGLLAARAFDLRGRWDGEDYGSLADALSAALLQLGQDVAATIADVDATQKKAHSDSAETNEE